MQFLDEFLDLNCFNRQKNICKGKFHKVFEVIDNKTDVVYVGKSPLKEINKFTKKEVINYCQDINIISKLNHPSIINFIGFSPIDFKENQNPVVITELASNDTLYSVIKSGDENQEWSFTKKLINIYGIASAMSYLHTHNIIHCDLTPKNVLVDKNFYPKLYSFNFSKEIDDNTFNQIPQINETSKHIAPEIKEGSDYSKSSDVYAFSYIVYSIINGNIELTKEDFSEIDETIPKCYYQLIEKCRSPNPEDRPTFDEILILLETNPDFLTEYVNKEEYESYIRMIKEYPTTFDPTTPILHLDYIMQEIEKIERSETIEKLINSKKPKELMQFLNDHCDEKTTSAVFDHCFAEIPDIYQELCREGISMNNNVANQKYALSLVFEKDTDKAVFKQMRSYLEESVKKGFVSSYFSLARLSYIFFNKENLAFNLAKAGSKLGEKHSKCLLGYFFAHGIGTKRDHKRGVTLMLESGADDYKNMFATDIGVYYIEELHEQAKSLIGCIHSLDEENQDNHKQEVNKDNQKEAENQDNQKEAENQDNQKEAENQDNQKEAENQDNQKEAENQDNQKEAENQDNQKEEEIQNNQKETETQDNQKEEEIQNNQKETETQDNQKEEEKQDDQKEAENQDNQKEAENQDNQKEKHETENTAESHDDYYYEALVEYDEVFEYEYEEDLNDDTAFYWFEKAYNMNKTKVTINNYGLCFLHGIGVPKDVEKAKKIFYDDPEKRDLEDFCHLSFLLEEPNPAEALKNLMGKLIRDGNCSIPIEYAINLYKMKQFKQAYNYFTLISKYNYPIAKFFIGVMKYRGEGCEQDIDDAYLILKRLSDIGVESASKFIEENFELSS